MALPRHGLPGPAQPVGRKRHRNSRRPLRSNRDGVPGEAFESRPGRNDEWPAASPEIRRGEPKSCDGISVAGHVRSWGNLLRKRDRPWAGRSCWETQPPRGAARLRRRTQLPAVRQFNHGERRDPRGAGRCDRSQPIANLARADGAPMGRHKARKNSRRPRQARRREGKSRADGKVARRSSAQ